MKKMVLKENNSCRMQCIAEENLEQEMDSQVEPFLKQAQICGWMEVAPEGGESQERDAASADSTSQKPETRQRTAWLRKKQLRRAVCIMNCIRRRHKKGRS